MKVILANKKTNCRAYGIDFNDKGVAECKKELVESLLATGVLLEVKVVTKVASK